MNDIRYVCLSDMHLGEEDSLLTGLQDGSSSVDPSHPSPVMTRLVQCLRNLIRQNSGTEKPALILNGDILELALAKTGEAAMVFKRFMELVMPEGDELFSEIHYLPGNHDHHLWESARETQFVEYIAGKSPRGENMPEPWQEPWHVTHLFAEDAPYQVPSYLLTSVARTQPHLKNFSIATAYPNKGIARQDGDKIVIFHHGHFVESIYQAMSHLKKIMFGQKMPQEIWDIEEENFAWIDFLWSTLGRSGAVGTDMEMIYEKIHYQRDLKRYLHHVARRLAKEYDLPGLGDTIETGLLQSVMDMLVDSLKKAERNMTDKPLSPDAVKTLKEYIEVPLQRQLSRELAKKNRAIPNDVTFIFGHTHKPYTSSQAFAGYPGPVQIYNTGGWVVETKDPDGTQGGWVALIDENLEVCAIEIYRESNNPNGAAVDVVVAPGTGQSQDFFQKIKNHVVQTNNEWRELSKTVADEVRLRSQYLRARINRIGA